MKVGAVLAEALPEALDFLQRLVSENSATSNPAGIARNAGLIAAQFEALGFTAEQVPARDPSFGRHLFLHRPGRGNRALMLVTHLDTVYSAEEEARNHFHWQVEGERIYGPGVIDIKGGTAMIWLVLETLRKVAPAVFAETHWLIAANAAEEELPEDFSQFCRERMPAGCRAALVFESCSGLGGEFSLVECRKGSANLRVSVEGRGAHAGSRHHEGANAIVALSRLVERIAALTDYNRKLTANVGWISGGGPINRVPHAAACEVNIRAFDPLVLEEAVAAIMNFQNEPATVRAASDDFPCSVQVKVLSRNPAWPPSPETGRLLTIWKSAAAEAGVALESEPRGGLSDGNYLSQFMPTLDGLGPFGRNGHASERSADGRKVPEYVEPASFLSMGTVNVNAILRLLEA